MAETFLDDDHGYERWRWAHPTGFVVATDRSPTASRLTVHRSTCPTISGEPPGGGTWTGSSMKVCDPSLSQLVRWAHAEVDADPTECHTCNPHADAVRPGADDPARRHPGAGA